MSDKPIYWVATAKDDLIEFPDGVRRKAGFELRAVQQGKPPSNFKRMPTVAKGVEEFASRPEMRTESFTF